MYPSILIIPIWYLKELRYLGTFLHFWNRMYTITCMAFLLTYTWIFRLAARYLTGAPKSVERAIRHLRPIIEERQRKIDEYGRDYPDKPVAKTFHDIYDCLWATRMIFWHGWWTKQKGMNGDQSIWQTESFTQTSLRSTRHRWFVIIYMPRRLSSCFLEFHPRAVPSGC